MARLARVVVLDHPHHVTQRGSGRARTFFGDGDYALYRGLLAEKSDGFQCCIKLIAKVAATFPPIASLSSVPFRASATN
jgi:hypothetical protein